MTRRVTPLSGRGADITWEQDGGFRMIRWGSTEFRVSQTLIDDLLSNYFNDPDRWYPLGAGMEAPMPGGFGEYLRDHSALSPRHASAMAAILVSEGVLEWRGNKPIELRRRRTTPGR